MSSKELPQEIFELLTQSQFAYFCTTDQNNQVHIAPVFFLYEKETNAVYVFSHLRSKKIRNIKANEKVCLTVDERDPENPFENRGVMVQGESTVEEITKQYSTSQRKRLIRIYEGFNQKYPVLSEAPVTQVKYEEYREVLVTVKASRMVYWKGPYFVRVDFHRR